MSTNYAGFGAWAAGVLDHHLQRGGDPAQTIRTLIEMAQMMGVELGAWAEVVGPVHPDDIEVSA